MNNSRGRAARTIVRRRFLSFLRDFTLHVAVLPDSINNKLQSTGQREAGMSATRENRCRNSAQLHRHHIALCVVVSRLPLVPPHFL